MRSLKRAIARVAHRSRRQAVRAGGDDRMPGRRARRAGAGARSWRDAVLDAIVEIRARDVGSAREEVVQLDAARHSRSAAVAGHDERAAGIAESRALGQRAAVEPAVQQPAEERIAGAEHVQHFDRKARHVDALVERRGAGPSMIVQPAAPRLTTIGARRALADGLQRDSRSVAPPAIRISSSVPTIRSHGGNRRCNAAVTSADATKRDAPSPAAVSFQSTGR